MAIDYSALKSELQTDPSGILAGIPAGADNALAAALNATRQTINIDKTSIKNGELYGLVNQSELAALSAAAKQNFGWLMSIQDIDPSIANIRQAFTAMFPNGTATFTAVTNALTRKGSRAEQLFGAGTVIHDSDVAKAKVS
jgi:hypothetical protein